MMMLHSGGTMATLLSRLLQLRRQQQVDDHAHPILRRALLRRVRPHAVRLRADPLPLRARLREGGDGTDAKVRAEGPDAQHGPQGSVHAHVRLGVPLLHLTYLHYLDG
ncbi:unnamed protein product [Urochloa humidicola]